MKPRDLPSTLHLPDVDAVPLEQLDGLELELLAFLGRVGMRRRQAAADASGDDCACFSVDEVAGLLRCSVDFVRERGAEWGIAKTLARDAQGRPTRTVYPKALLRAYLNGQPAGEHATRSPPPRRTPR
jgi:hypothetical protein